MTLQRKQPRSSIEKKVRNLENEVKRLKQQEQQMRASLKTVQTELQQSSDRLRKTMGGIIQAMSLTIEMRDPYTSGHQRRVTKLCRAIATIMGFSWERIQGFRMAAAIHDLGKIHVPAEILSKPGRLTENEFGIIKTHPQIGFDILKGIEFSWPIAQIVHQHHERMDGSGYPQGLCGKDILLEARILAVADVVEAMSSHRPYRPALGPESAIDEILQHRGILYDADAVDACLKAIGENKALIAQSSSKEK
jgi:HD-GYP domain-containing protein (c-di-GMP phosphodiesterase class II)